MTQVAKYNLYKGLSTALTIGTPFVTLAACSDMFVHSTKTSVSAGAVFTFLLVLLAFKDKIAENFKCPSAFLVSLATFIAIVVIENVIIPLKMVCIMTMIATFADELTFKSFYKSLENLLPDKAKAYKHFGFIMTKDETIRKEDI